MSKRFINTFSGGIDRDTSVNKYSNQHYYDAENIRPISNNTFTSGAVSNVDGLLQKIDFNSITYDNLASTSTISNITVFKVVAIRDTFVFFAVGDLTEDTLGLYANTNFIVKGTPDSNGDFTSLTIVYMYGGDNFTSDLSVIGRYESEAIQKVYWADGTNPLRSINILDIDLGSTTIPTNDPNILDHIPEVDFTNIDIVDTVPGGNYTSGIVQYAYQLYNLNGSITTMSPVSNPVLLSSFAENEVGGSDIGEDTNKSVNLEITNLDSRFNRVRVLALFYEELFQNPTVNVIFEGVNSGSVSIVDTNEPIDTLSYEEFLVFNNTTYIPQALETKNNILFTANVKEATFQSDAIDAWDSRVYMTNSGNSTVLVEEADGTTNAYNSTNWDTVPSTSDALVLDVKNLSDHNIQNADDTTSSLYRRFKPGTSTPGGEGPNIEFEYTLQNEVIDNNHFATYDIDVNKSTVTGLQPNEMYRFGVVFYNTKGQASFVKWIQDIRIPHVELIDGTKDTFYDNTNGQNAYHVNIKFTIKNLPADSNITSWQIVRAKRNVEDREILYNGYYVASAIRSGDTFARTWLDWTGVSGQYFSGLPLESKYYESGGTDEDHILLWELLSPEINFNKSTYNLSNTKSLINHYLGYWPIARESDRHNINTAKYYNSSVWGEGFIARDIENYKLVEPPTYVGDPSEGRIYTLGDTDKEKFFNMSQPTTSPYTDNIGIGGTKLVVNHDLFDSTDLGEQNRFPSMGWNLTGSNYFRSLYGQVIKDVTFSRYGGITYEARQLTEYIPYGKINSISDSVDQTIEFNGDTYIKMFTYLRNIAQEDYPNEWGQADGLQEIVVMPVHTSINLDYRNDDIFKYATIVPSGAATETGDLKDMWVQETVQLGLAYQPDFYDESIGDLYTYNSVYSKQNEAKKFYPKPFDFVEESTIDTKISASEVKVNGEYIDNWTIFKSSNFLEVDSSYGAITELKRFMNRLYCFQQDAISLLAVNDRSLIRDDSGIQLALGTGGILERYDYITTTTGLQRKNALVDSKRALYFVDEYNKELWVLQGTNSQELSRIKGFSSEINSLIPSDKILLGFDPNFNEIYLTFDNETWVYSEIVGSVISKFSINPDIYFSHRGLLYSGVDNILSKNNDPSSKLGNKSYITLLINPNNTIINSFDNLDFRTSVELGIDSTKAVAFVKYRYKTSTSSGLHTATLLDYSDQNIPIVSNPEDYGTNGFDVISYSSTDTYITPKTIELAIAPGDTVTGLEISVSSGGDNYYPIYYTDSHTGAFSLDMSSLIPALELVNFGTVDRIKYSNSYIDTITKETKLSDPGKTVSHLARAFRTQVPLTEDGNRLVDTYLLVTFEYDNTSNNNFKLHDVISYYRPSNI